MKIELWHAVCVWGALAVFFVGIIIKLVVGRTKRDEDSRKALWRRCDELGGRIQEMRENLVAQYYNKPEIRDYVTLVLKPVNQALDTNGKTLDEIRSLVKELIRGGED